MEDFELVAELWRRRVEWLWKMCEETSGRPVDVEWLDEQIAKDEEHARKAP
jgi:hypothetical protein